MTTSLKTTVILSISLDCTILWMETTQTLKIITSILSKRIAERKTKISPVSVTRSDINTSLLNS